MTNPQEAPPDRQLWTGYLVAPLERPASSVPVGLIVASVFRSWPIWGSAGVLGGIIGVILALSMTPIYRATTVVAINSEAADSLGSGLIGGQLGGLAGLAGISLGGSNRRMEYLAMLDSRILADQFIAANQLKYVFFAKDWDAANNRWTSKKAPTDEAAYQYFTEKVRIVSEDRRTGLVTVSMQSSDPVAAARWANEYVRRANDLLRERAVTEASSSLAFLDRELANASAIEIRQAIFQLVEAQQKQKMLATVRDEYIFHTIDPAKDPDPENFVKPKRTLIATGCGLVGGVLGLAIALYRDRRSFQIGSKK
jgi:uncharacterized protein involved in exopolysaccharide biosynthesis